MRPYKPTIYLLTLTFAALIFSACSQPKAKKLTTITIAFQEWVGYGLFYLAQEKGFLKEEGIELFFVDEQMDSARRDAFKEGMLDVEAGTIDLLVSKRAQGTPVVAVCELDQSFGADALVVVKNIQKLSDLSDRGVVFSRDDVGETFLAYLLFKEGLSLDKLTIVLRAPEKVAEAFLNGEADAAVTWEPWVTKALQRPGSHILISTKEKSGIIIDTLNAREDFLKNNPEAIKGLLRGWFRALEYYKAHPQEASEIISRHYNITPAEYRKNVTGLVWVDYAQQIAPTKYNQWADVFNAISEIKFKNGRITANPLAQSAINNTLLKGLYENSQ